MYVHAYTEKNWGKAPDNGHLHDRQSACPTEPIVDSKTVQPHFDEQLAALGDELRTLLTTTMAEKEAPAEPIIEVETEALPEQEPAEPMETMEQIQHLLKTNSKVISGVVSGAMAGWILHSLFI